MNNKRVVVVTVTYGNRFVFLSQVIDSVMQDNNIVKFIIVDNGSKNKEEIKELSLKYKDKIIVIREEKNLGSAGGFAAGLNCARELDCDYVLLLDDDNVPEQNFIDKFFEIKSLFTNEKVVLCGNRINIPGSQRYFYERSLKNPNPRGTFFEVFSFDKLANFFLMLIGIRVNKTASGPFIPVLPNEGFIYGGSFLPIKAVREAPLPDKSLVLYGDDIEYSWGVTRLGYSSYICTYPIIKDVDLSFGDSHIFGLFNIQTHHFKVYYRVRNMVRISIRNTKQLQILLFINIIFWTLGLFILGLLKYGVNKNFFKRAILIIRAIADGYNSKSKAPKEAELP